MPIVLRHNEALEFNRVDYSGSITLAELSALAEFNAATPSWLTYDTMSIVVPGADFLSINFAELDTLFAQYRTIYAPINMLIMRRSAWLCQSDAARKHVRYWLGDRDTRESLHSDVRLFDSFETAGEWLLLRPTELGHLISGEGFAEVFRTEAPVATRAR